MKTVKAILLTLLIMGMLGAIMLIGGCALLFAQSEHYFEETGTQNGDPVLFSFAKITQPIMEIKQILHISKGVD